MPRELGVAGVLRELVYPVVAHASGVSLPRAKAHGQSLTQRSMHELSMAHGIVDQAVAAATEANAERVVAVHLTIGRLAGVEPGALQFCFDIASKGTLLEGSRLEIRELPLVVWCAHCLREVELPGVQRFRCPTCQTPCGEIRQGREMQIESVEIEP